jgi:hypothetical protein
MFISKSKQKILINNTSPVYFLSININIKYY